MKNDSEIYRRILTGFVAEEDPLLSMLKWMMEQLMQIEAEQKGGESSLKVKKDGRPKGSGKVLSQEQERQIMHLLIDKTHESSNPPSLYGSGRISES